MSKHTISAAPRIAVGRLRPRNDMVILERTDLGVTAGGVVVPMQSKENKKWVVVAVGPKIEDLKPGDEVEAMGTLGQDIASLPGKYPQQLYITKEANILLKVDPE